MLLDKWIITEIILIGLNLIEFRLEAWFDCWLHKLDRYSWKLNYKAYLKKWWIELIAWKIGIFIKIKIESIWWFWTRLLITNQSNIYIKH